MTEAMFQMMLEEMKDIKSNMATKDDIKEIREEMKNFATKDDLKNFATKDDIKELREEMKKFATKDDIKELDKKIDLVATELNQSILTILRIIEEKVAETAKPLQIQLDKQESTIEVLNKRTLAIESEQVRIKKQMSEHFAMA